MRGKLVSAAVVGAALMLLVGGCATVQTAGGPATTATSEELGRELNSGCPENANLIDPYDLVTGIAEWIRAVDVEGERKSDERVAVTIRDAEGRAREAGLIGSAWPGIDWGLAHDSEVWIGMSTLTEGNVRMVMVVTPSREVFFAGSCSDTYRAYFYSALGDRAGELLAGLPGIDPADAYDYLGLPDPYAAEEPTVPEIVNLNDEGTDASVLEDLHGIELSIALSDVVGDGSLALCTKIEAGWNDCVQTDGDAVKGITIPAWADESGRVEFWLLDRNANAEKPLGLLGVATATGRSLDVLIDTSDIAADGSFRGADRVKVNR